MSIAKILKFFWKNYENFAKILPGKNFLVEDKQYEMHPRWTKKVGQILSEFC